MKNPIADFHLGILADWLFLPLMHSESLTWNKHEESQFDISTIHLNIVSGLS